jgi:DNA-binding MarR family transcriptional regulator
MSRHLIGDEADHVELRREQWRKELPDVDTIGMAIFGRARLTTMLARTAIEEVFSRHGLDTGEFDVLATMLRSGAPYRLRPTELFKSLMISSGGLTARLSRLEKAGLVTRHRSENDARSLMVELTPDGRALAERAFCEDMAVEAQLLEGLAKEEREQLATLLYRLWHVVHKRVAGDDAASRR